MVTIGSWAILMAGILILGMALGVAGTAEVIHHHVLKDGTFKFRWKGKRLCVRGNRK